MTSFATELAIPTIMDLCTYVCTDTLLRLIYKDIKFTYLTIKYH